MLSNKYFIFAIFALLLLVAAYNIKFFSSDKALTNEVKTTLPQPPVAALYDKGVLPKRIVINKDNKPWRDPFSTERTSGQNKITEESGIITN